MSSLSISLDNEPIGMEPMFLKGTLLLHQNEANSLVVAGETCLLQVVGTFDQHEIVVSSHTLPLTPHMNFDIPLDLDYEGLAYSVRACIRDSRKGLTLNVARPLNLDFQSPPPPTSYPSSFCSSSSASSLSIASSIPCSRLCWGMSAQSQWRYELELPQRIEDSGFQITLRTQFRSTPQPLETCLIGVRVYDSAQAVLMATSHVLINPSSTWTEEPYVLMLELDRLSKVANENDYHLQITLNYHANETDWAYLDCMIPVLSKKDGDFSWCESIGSDKTYWDDMQ